MISVQILFAAARFGLALGFLAFGCLYMVRKTQLDAFRSSLFAIRDQMFYDLACQGRPSDCLAYQRLRDEINGLLRFAHQFDLMSLLFATFVVRDQTMTNSGLLATIEAEPDPVVRQYLLDVYRKVGRRAMRYVVLEGSQVFFTLPVLLAYVLWKRRGRWINELPPDLADRLASLGRDDSDEAKLLLTA